MIRLLFVAIVIFAATPLLADDRPSTPAPIGVEAFMERGGSVKGVFRIRGIVERTAPERQLFSIVDVNDQEEVARTGKTQCVTLPVRWTKNMPALYSIVVVSGEVRELEGGRVFVADTLTAEDRR